MSGVVAAEREKEREDYDVAERCPAKTRRPRRERESPRVRRGVIKK